MTLDREPKLANTLIERLDPCGGFFFVVCGSFAAQGDTLGRNIKQHGECQMLKWITAPIDSGLDQWAHSKSQKALRSGGVFVEVALVLATHKT